jgi:O-antigen/teichoic acid export membrane protein
MVLTPRYGIVGAGLALLISTSTRLICVLLCFPLFLKMRVPDILPKWQDISSITKMIVNRINVARGRQQFAVDGAD